ncbi:MAG: SLC13 family permease [Burkholderiales bacterium]
MALVVIALAMFASGRIPLETSSLVILGLLVLGFELFPYSVDGVTLHPTEFFYGFGHEALIAVCALMILGRGLESTGALQPVATGLARLWTRSPAFSFLATLVCAAFFSAFVNNTPIVVLLLPILIGVSLRSETRASEVLMPMGFATLIGGMATTIGTSTNLLVVSVAADLGMRRFEMFDFAPPVLVASVFAFAYLWLVAPRLLPERTPPLRDTSPRVFEALMHIDEESAAKGMTIEEVREKTGGNMRIRSVEREGGLVLSPVGALALRPGDRLRVKDTPDNLKEFERQLGAKLHNIGEGGELVTEEHPLSAEDQQIAEIVITENSPLYRRTLAESRFIDRYNLIALAIHRPGAASPRATDVADVRLQSGDVLLVQGPEKDIAALRTTGRLLVLDATVDLPRTRRAPLALAIMFGVVAVAALGIVPIAVSALVGVILMLATRCLEWDDLTAALSAQVVMIVVASLALGLALMRTGGADYVAQLYLAAAKGLPPVIVVSGLMGVMAVLTNVVSNNAAAVIGTPIALSIAQQLESPPEPFVLAVLFGANLSFATPMAFKTNLLILSAGGYKFSDFLRAGVPLTLLMWIALSVTLSVTYRL